MTEVKARPIFCSKKLYTDTRENDRHALGAYYADYHNRSYIPRAEYDRYCRMSEENNIVDKELQEHYQEATYNNTFTSELIPLIKHYTGITLSEKDEPATDIKNRIFRKIRRAYAEWCDAQDGENQFDAESFTDMRGIGNFLVDIINCLSTIENYRALPIVDQINCAFHCIMRGTNFCDAIILDPGFAEYLFTETPQYGAHLDHVAALITYIKDKKISVHVMQECIDRYTDENVTYEFD